MRVHLVIELRRTPTLAFLRDLVVWSVSLASLVAASLWIGGPWWFGLAMGLAWGFVMFDLMRWLRRRR